MAITKKKKELTYRGKPLHRIGDRIYYGNLDDKYVLALDLIEKKKLESGFDITSKVKILLIENVGEFGKGQVFRKAERTDLYHAFDIGEWWLKDALQN